jgi:hypothetical protein
MDILYSEEFLPHKMAQEAKDDLLVLIRKYRELDASIKKINKNLTDLRDSRGELEGAMRGIFERPEYTGIGKMALSDDSYIRIQRPGEWKKPWGLSKRELQAALTEFFANGGPKTADACYAHIVESREKASVGDTMQFARIERS